MKKTLLFKTFFFFLNLISLETAIEIIEHEDENVIIYLLIDNNTNWEITKEITFIKKANKYEGYYKKRHYYNSDITCSRNVNHVFSEDAAKVLFFEFRDMYQKQKK